MRVLKIKERLADVLVPIWYQFKMTCNFGPMVHKPVLFTCIEDGEHVYRCGRCGHEMDRLSLDLVADFYRWYSGQQIPVTTEDRLRENFYQRYTTRGD